MAETKPGGRRHRTMRESWPFYLREHSRRHARLHLAGTAVALACIDLAIALRQPWSCSAGWSPDTPCMGGPPLRRAQPAGDVHRPVQVVRLGLEDVRGLPHGPARQAAARRAAEAVATRSPALEELDLALVPLRGGP